MTAMILFMAAMLASPSVMDIGPGDRVRVLKYDQWKAIESAGGPTYTLARLAFCESGIDPTNNVMDVDGTPSIGAYSVKPQFHGTVPPDLAGQTRQAVAIIAMHGTAPWSAAHGCSEWNR